MKIYRKDKKIVELFGRWDIKIGTTTIYAMFFLPNQGECHKFQTRVNFLTKNNNKYPNLKNLFQQYLKINRIKSIAHKNSNSNNSIYKKEMTFSNF